MYEFPLTEEVIRAVREAAGDDGRLWEYARDLLGRYPREDVRRAFTEACGIFRQQGNEYSEDIVLDMLDWLVGWCAPSVSLAEGSYNLRVI